jgi:uncharacterized protein (TIGR03084 family)
MKWTPWDVVAHLHFFDRLSLLAVTDEDAFAVKRKDLIASFMKGETTAEVARREFGPHEPGELVEHWHATCREMAEQLGRSDPKRRLPWFGPDMGVRMFTTARFMETWAHGQEVYDLLRVRRSHSDRIKNVAVIGMMDLRESRPRGARASALRAPGRSLGCHLGVERAERE